MNQILADITHYVILKGSLYVPVHTEQLEMPTNHATNHQLVVVNQVLAELMPIATWLKIKKNVSAVEGILAIHTMVADYTRLVLVLQILAAPMLSVLLHPLVSPCASVLQALEVIQLVLKDVTDMNALMTTNALIDNLVLLTDVAIRAPEHAVLTQIAE